MHTKNLPVVTISHCPLSSKFTFSKFTPYIRRCLEIIESARITWGYYSDEYKSCCYEIVDGVEVPKKFPPYSTLKLTSARSIQSWYVEHSDLFLTIKKAEAIKKAVQDVRRYARPGIDNDITDKEILAIFAICEAFDVVDKIQRGNSGDAIKEKILSASTFLNLAKAGTEPATQDTAKQESVKIQYDKDRHILFTNKKHLQLTQDKKILVKYLFEGRKAISFLVEKLAESKGKNKLHYSASSCRKLINKTNKVIEKEFGIKDFIRNEKNKSGFYNLTYKPKEGNIEVMQR